MKTRAKFTCIAVTKRKGSHWDPAKKTSVFGFLYEAEFYAVTDSSTPENESFWASTPTGSIKISCVREDHFVPGQDYYVEFDAVPVAF